MELSLPVYPNPLHFSKSRLPKMRNGSSDSENTDSGAFHKQAKPQHEPDVLQAHIGPPKDKLLQEGKIPPWRGFSPAIHSPRHYVAMVEIHKAPVCLLIQQISMRHQQKRERFTLIRIRRMDIIKLRIGDKAVPLIKPQPPA